jgi:hypothetical protein
LAVIFGFVPAFAFDKDYGIMDTKDLHLSIVSVSTTGTGTADKIHYTDDIPRKPIKSTITGTFWQGGTAFVVNGKYLLTAAHVVSPAELKVRTPTGEMDYYLLRTVDNMVVSAGGVPARIAFIDTKKDLAILEYGPILDGALRILDGKVSSSDRLERGDAIVVIGCSNPLDEFWRWNYEVRRGHVKDAYPKFPGHPDNKDLFETTTSNDFTMDMKLIPGNSGSPVVAFDNGKPVIIGIAKAGLKMINGGPFYTYAAKVDSLMPILEGGKDVPGKPKD